MSTRYAAITSLVPAQMLFAGCTNKSPATGEPIDIELCSWAAEDQVDSVTIAPGAHRIRNPLNSSGFSASGRSLDFPWASDGDLLRRVNITMTWDVPTGGQERLRLEVDDADDSIPPWQYKVFEGPSPLNATLEVNSSAELGGNLHVIFMTAHEGIVGTVALVEQRVVLTMQQTYAC